MRQKFAFRRFIGSTLRTAVWNEGSRIRQDYATLGAEVALWTYPN